MSSARKWMKLAVVASAYRFARAPTQRSVATGSAVVPPVDAGAGTNAYDGSVCASSSEASSRVGSSVGYEEGSMTNADSAIAVSPSLSPAV